MDKERAWEVEGRDGDLMEIVYAETRGKAIYNGLGDYGLHFTEKTARRAPNFDKYLANGGPTKGDFLREGWWFECHWNNCQKHVTQDEGGAIGDKVYCEEHLPMAKESAHVNKCNTPTNAEGGE